MTRETWLARMAAGRALARERRRERGMPAGTGPAYWRRQLGTVPSWALADELERRGDAPATDRIVRLPGLTVDPVGGAVDWRGDAYVVGGRSMEVLYCLAQARRDGHRRLRYAEIGKRVWRGFAPEDARQNARVTVSSLRTRFPGLLETAGPGGGGLVGLVLDAPSAETGVA